MGMKMIGVTAMVFVVSLTAIGNGADDAHDYHDRSNWIDPSDMLNYDASTQKMKKSKQESKIVQKDQDDQQNSPLPSIQEFSSTSLESLQKLYDHMTEAFPENKDVFVEMIKKYVSEFGCVSGEQPSDESTELQKCISDKNKLRQQLMNMKDEQEEQHSDSLEKTYFKQYVRTLLQHYSRSVADGSFLLYSTEVLLSYDDIITLERFAMSEHGNVQDAHEVLRRMMQHVQLMEAGDVGHWNENFKEHYKEYLTITLQIVAVLTLASVAIVLPVRFHLSWKQLIIKILVLLFLISIPWNWWHMYKMAVAKRQAEAVKDMPIECRPEKQTASQSFWSALRSTFTFNTDKCAEYYEKMLVDPAYEVAPTQAVAVTVTKFFVEPLEHIGQAVGKLIHGTLRELPVQIWPFALAFICMMTLFILTLVFGYRIKLFYLFGIEPGKRTPQPSIKENEQHKQLQNRIEDLTCQLERLSVTQSRQLPVTMQEAKPPVASLFQSKPECVATTPPEPIEYNPKESKPDIQETVDSLEDEVEIKETAGIISRTSAGSSRRPCEDNGEIRCISEPSCASKSIGENSSNEDPGIFAKAADSCVLTDQCLAVGSIDPLMGRNPDDKCSEDLADPTDDITSGDTEAALDLTLRKDKCDGQIKLPSVENLGAGDS